MKRLAIPLVALLFILPALACGSTAGTGAKKGQTYGQGQTASVKNWDVTLTGVERPGKDIVWSQFNNKSTAVGEWVVAAVKLKNTGNQNFGVNTFDFQLEGGGVTYKVSSDIGALTYGVNKGGQQISGQVPPGSEATIYLPFDVTMGATGLALVFNQDSKPKFTIP